MVKKLLMKLGIVIGEMDVDTYKYDKWTADNAIALSHDGMWELRYCLDWDNLDLLKKVTCSMIDDEDQPLAYFINWYRWTIVSPNAKNMDGKFLKRHYTHINLRYIYKHFDEYKNLTPEDLSDPKITAYYIQMMARKARVYYLQTSVDGYIVGIPAAYRHNGRIEYAHKQMELISIADRKRRQNIAAIHRLRPDEGLELVKVEPKTIELI